MKSPAKKIFAALISGIVLLNAGLSFAQNNEIVYETKLSSSEDAENAERKREFWEKFRESVEPREKEPPQEVRPGKAKNPEEVHPREVHPQKVQSQEKE